MRIRFTDTYNDIIVRRSGDPIKICEPLDLQVAPREGVRISGMSKGLTPK